MSLNEILREAVQREASDVLLIAGLPVSYKVNGHICREGERLFPEHTRVLVEELYSLAARPIERFLETGDDDFSSPASPASGSTPSASAAPWPWSSGWCPFPSRTGGRWASLKT